MLENVLRASAAKAIIYDMDGTLVDNMDYHRLAFLEWSRRLGLGYTETELMALTHGTIEEIVRRIFPPETPEEELDRQGRLKEAIYREIYTPHLQLIPGCKNLLHDAYQAGILQAVATAGNWENVAFTLDGLHIRAFFHAIVAGDDVTHGKPHPEVFLRTAEKLDVAPKDCLVFEDSPAGTEAARRAGMKCVVINPMRPRAEFGDTSHVLHFAKDYYDLEFKALGE